MKMLARLSAPALFLLSAFGSAAFAQHADQITTQGLSGAVPKFHRKHGDGPRHKVMPAFGPGVTGIDSLVNFTGSFTAPGFDSNGKPQSNWPYSMIGNDPTRHRTTVINAPIIPVSVLLLDANGQPAYDKGQLLFSDANQFVGPVLNSPVFGFHRYSSSEDPTQFTDAVQRAEFNRQADDDWHTLLQPALRRSRLMTLAQGTYQYKLNADGSCCAFILVNADDFGNALFPPVTPDGTTIIGAAELAGDMTTKDLTTLLLPNVYLYEDNDPTDCCILGYHSYDIEAGTAANGNLPRLYVVAYASWISPGIFNGIGDVTGLSHELAESINDPFVNNFTPWWLAPNGLCQNNLEVGDVIEGLPNATFPITMNGYTYHPQNDALLPWFEFQAPSKAIQHAYSYPNTTVVTSLSAPQKASCK